MARSWDEVRLGRTGLEVGRLGIASSYGLSAADVEHAHARGVRYFYWGTMQRPGFGTGMARLAKRRREDLVIVVQTYTRVASLMRLSLEQALRRLGIDHADVLLLGWWNQPPPPRIRDAALALVDAGKARHIMVSSHVRRTFPALAAEPAYGAIMVRYNAAHPGAESEVFPHLGEARPGVVAYTATRWGGLLDRRLVPAEEPVPRASDCYRFALSHPSVDLVVSGPSGRAELDEALATLDRGPMSEDELAWMKRVGKAVRDAALIRRADAPITVVDRIAARVRAWLT